ncbi:MAG: chitobiase/beta-hexosaminidase C-terminal domain-containing protein, partial [Acidobacteriota bacterium]
TTASVKYNGPITVSATETIRAIATASGHTQSNVASATYTITQNATNYTFSLPVLYQDVRYDLYFKGDPNSYAQQTQYKNSPFGPQAQYLSAFLTNSMNRSANCCGISGVWVYAGGQPLAASKISVDLLAQTLLWAYGYVNFVLVPGGTQDLQNDYAQIQAAVQNEWVQQSGIALANLANLATVIGPIVDDLSKQFGSAGANQLALEIQLIADLLQGSFKVYEDYPKCGGAIISTLQSLKLISGPNYDPSELIMGLAGSVQQNQNGPAIAQTLYSTAYSDSCSSSAALLSAPVAAKAANFLGTLALNTAMDMAKQGGSIFAEAYFEYGLSIATAGRAATTAAFGDVLSCQLPAAIGETIISNYIMPQAALLQEEVNLQNLLFETAFPQFFLSVSSMIVPNGSSQLANLAAGVGTTDGPGLIYEFQSLWFTTDYQLVSNEICLFCGDRLADDKASAGTYATGAQQALTLVQSAYALASALPIL